MINLPPNKIKTSEKMNSSTHRDLHTKTKPNTPSRDTPSKDFRPKTSIFSSNQEVELPPKLPEGLMMTPVKRYKSKQSIQVGEKSPIQLMQDILKGARQQNELISAYYSAEAEQLVSDLLTNRYKRNNYISDLEKQINQLNPEVGQNYELLILLLQQTSKGDIQVKHTSKGMELSFNQSIIDQQQLILQKLKQEKQAKQQEIKQIVQDYQGIIGNFNQIISKMVNGKGQKDEKQIF